jgi:hypothetical protein
VRPGNVELDRLQRSQQMIRIDRPDRRSDMTGTDALAIMLVSGRTVMVAGRRILLTGARA